MKPRLIVGVATVGACLAMSGCGSSGAAEFPTERAGTGASDRVGAVIFAKPEVRARLRAQATAQPTTVITSGESVAR